MIKVVILDLSGIYFTNGLKIFYDKEIKKLGISEEKFNYAFEKGISVDYRTGKIEEDTFWKNVLKYLDLNIDPNGYAMKWHSAYKLIPESREFIIQVKNKGYITACLSNSVKERSEYLEKKYSFKKDFDYVFLSNEIGFLKPDKNCFKYAIQQLGLLPEECIFIDDSEGNLVPAKQLGMNTFLTIDDAKKVLLDD